MEINIEEIKEKIKKATDIVNSLNVENSTTREHVFQAVLTSLLVSAIIEKPYLSQRIETKERMITTLPEITFPELVKKLGKRKLSNAEKITIAAYYLHVYLNEREFTIDKIKELFKEVGWKIPGNLSRDADVSVKKAYIHCKRKKNRKFCWITNTGIKYVEGLLGENEE